jgi:hypothetical protein
MCASVATFDLLSGSAALPQSCATIGTPFKANLSTSEEPYDLRIMSNLKETSRSYLDEKDDVVHTKETDLEIDLTKYHEHRAGRLLLDPKCVRFLSFR